MKSVIAAIAALVVLVNSPLWAQSNPVVVELFTSQGCSSCPPADALMKRLAQREDVIGLSLHVDYWDYIGWKDEFGDPAYTRRQKAYAASAGRNMIYTPQMVVNGREAIVGARAIELAELISKHGSAPARATVEAERQGAAIVVRMRPVAAPLKGPLTVQLVRYTPWAKSKITRGENAGRELEYANIVDGWRILGQWDGAGPAEIRAELSGMRPAVVLVQRPGPGEIVAAARVR